MKQTNPSSALRMTVSLGILGLNEDFVQLNEVMNIILNFHTQLCNTAWEKKLLAQVAKRTCF